MTSLGVASYLGLSTTPHKRLEKLWAAVQADFMFEPEIQTLVGKFVKKFLVGSAADARAASGRAFPATQPASCCPSLCLKLLCQAIIAQNLTEGKMVSHGVLLCEIPGSKVSRQLALDHLQMRANVAHFAFWSVIINKSQTVIAGAGKISNGVVLDYLSTADCDSYDLFVESNVLQEVGLQSFY